MLIAVAATILSIAYWSMFGLNAYSTFHEYGDLGIFAYNFYFNIHFPQIAHGLQYIVFGNHIAPTLLLILPIYAFFPSAITLLVIQAAVLSITGLVLFFVAKDILKDSRISLAICLAFLLSPGIHGMLVFDFHAESFLSIFYILTFYYWLKANRAGFAVSLLLFLGVIEVAPLLAATLGIGMLVYSLREGKRSMARNMLTKRRRWMAVACIAVSIIFLLAYSMITSHLAQAYASGYPGLPQRLYVTAGAQNTLVGFVSSFSANPMKTLTLDYYTYFTFQQQYLLYAIVIVILGFGLLCLFDPLELLILALPWLVMVFVIGDTGFILTYTQYFGFVVAPTAVAAIIGFMRFKDGKGILGRHLRKYRQSAKYVLLLSFIIPAGILAASPVFVRNRNIDNLGHAFLFQQNSSMATADAQLDSVIAAVPQNASVFAESFIMAHVPNREYQNYVDPPNGIIPDYVISDYNTNISYGELQDLQAASLITNYSYSLVMQNGSAMLFKKT